MLPKALVFLAFFGFTATAVHVLKPITELSEVIPRAPKRRYAPGRDVFDPHKEFTFHYANEGNNDIYLANFTVKAHKEHEAIIPIETFAERLKSIVCDEQSVTIEFQSASTYQYASKVWDWVNQHENHTFILVPRADQCGGNGERVPYLVTNIQVFEKTLSVKLAATRQSWENAAPNFHLRTTHVQRNEGEEFENDDEEIEHSFIDESIKASVEKIEELDAQLAETNNSNSNPEDVFQLQQDLDKVVVELYDLIEEKAFRLLEDIEFVYGDRVSELVREIETNYDSTHENAQKQFEQAEDLWIEDPSASWEAWEAAIALETKAMKDLWAGFDAIIHLGLNEDMPVEEYEHDIERKREEAHEELEKRFLLASLGVLIQETIGTVGQLIGIGIVKLLGVDKKPIEIGLTLPKWDPKPFGANKKDDGIDFSAGPEFQLGGKIIGEIEAEVKDLKPHIFRVTIKPQDIFAEAGFKITADGQRSDRLEKQIIEVNIPLGRAAFEIPHLVYIGPKLSVGVWVEILNMEAKAAEFYAGIRADIPNESRIVLDGLNKDNNKKEGWEIRQTQKGPTMKGEMNGRLSSWVGLRLSFAAKFLNKFGIDAGFEGRVPEIGMNFKTTTDAAEACPNSENPSAIHVTRDLSCAFLVFGGLNDQTPWNHQLARTDPKPLFSPMCFPMDAPK